MIVALIVIVIVAIILLTGIRIVPQPVITKDNVNCSPVDRT